MVSHRVRQLPNYPHSLLRNSSRKVCQTEQESLEQLLIITTSHSYTVVDQTESSVLLWIKAHSHSVASVSLITALSWPQFSLILYNFQPHIAIKFRIFALSKSLVKVSRRNVTSKLELFFQLLPLNRMTSWNNSRFLFGRINRTPAFLARWFGPF